MLTDTHCHLYWNKFDADRAEVIQRAVDAGVTRMLVPGVDIKTSREAIQLTERYEQVYAAVGFHPTDLDDWNASSIENLRDLLPSPSPVLGRGARGEGGSKIVAIGEIGLDHYWVKEEAKRAFQREKLKAQLALAQEVGLPVVIHMREEKDAWFGSASEQLLAILSEWSAGLKSKGHPLAERPGVLHSFNGTLETAQKAIAMNFFIGVTGPVTYKTAEQKRAIISQLPATRLLIETDAPFLAPVPHRGKRNEPAFVGEIADKIAEVKSISKEEVAAVTTQNAARLFLW
ncbi:MAG: TatD family hydrolase [Chloroflexi bacterium]|nr:TatD family hydrolase [Chloroflexota bacterium]